MLDAELRFVEAFGEKAAEFLPGGDIVGILVEPFDTSVGNLSGSCSSFRSLTMSLRKLTFRGLERKNRNPSRRC